MPIGLPGMTAQYSITHNAAKHQLKLKIFTPDSEEPTSAKCSAATDEIVFICAPYYLRIKPQVLLEPGEYYPKFDDDKFVFEYKITTGGESGAGVIEIDDADQECAATYPYGFNSSFTDSLALMRDELGQMCGIDSPDKLAPKERREKRTLAENEAFQLDYYKHDYWHIFTDDHCFVQVPEIPLDYEMSKSDERRLQDLVQRPLNSLEIRDTQKIDLGLFDMLFAMAYDWRQNNSEVNEATSAWVRLKLSATLTYFDEFETLEDVFRAFYRRALTYPLYRAKVVVRSCIEDVYRGLETHGQQWILKQLLTTYTLFNLNNYCILNRYYIVEYIKYVYRFVSNDDAKQMAELLKDFHVYRFHAENFEWNLAQEDSKLMREMFSDELAGSDDSDDVVTTSEEESGSDEAGDEPDLTDQMKALKV